MLSDGEGGSYISGGTFIGDGPGSEQVTCLLHMDAGGALLSASQLRLEENYVGGRGLLNYLDGLLLWGRCDNNTAQWKRLDDVSLLPYEASWSSANGSGELLNWTTSNGLGSKTDITQDLVLDSGAGLFDGQAMYRPMPK
jgi:hypothetical protein